MVKKIFMSFMIVAMMLTVVSFSPRHASATGTAYESNWRAKKLGGVNLSRYCKNVMGGTGVILIEPMDAHSWRCLVEGEQVEINVNDACRNQYNNDSAYAQYRKLSEPRSWVCYRP